MAAPLSSPQSSLSQLKQFSTIVADTGEIELIKAVQPIDATTNPSLILAAAKRPEYASLLAAASNIAKQYVGNDAERADYFLDLIFVHFGKEIIKYIPGRVSTEIDPSLSFDMHKTMSRAQRIIALYEKLQVPRDRVLIKIAGTWEGLRAAELLEMEGIHCNVTLLFHLAQAVAAADMKVTLISPFVGRILDWYKKETGRTYAPAEDPGVCSVQTIYAYLKKFDYKTQVMAASFRSTGEILELAGCDLLTCAPKLLDELENMTTPVLQKLSAQRAKESSLPRMNLTESQFRLAMNQDKMASDKLAEGIRNFIDDYEKLRVLALPLLSA